MTVFLRIIKEYYIVRVFFLLEIYFKIGFQERSAKMDSNIKNRFSPAVMVIIIFGIISLLGDLVYETARSANSQYFNLLGITAAKIGLVFGLGEFSGYFLRLIAGIWSDRSGKYWAFMFVGYGMLLAVPLIGFTINWNILIVLILVERIGKALRNPAKDTVLSGVAENQFGLGFAFGLQEALDQVGAFTGPLIFTAIFYFTGRNSIKEYQFGYHLLSIPFILLILFLFSAYKKIKAEHLITTVEQKDIHKEKIRPIFWVYTTFTFFCTLGFVNFSTIGYHLKANNLLSDGNITLLYSLAMLIDAVVALIIGKAYDRIKIRTGKKTGGIRILIIIPIMSLLLPLLSLSYSRIFAVVGMIIFGIIIGSHETVMRSAIGDITPFHKRGTSYGLFNTAYGLAILGGAATMGLLYEMKQTGLIIAFTFIVELIAITLYFKMNQMIENSH